MVPASAFVRTNRRSPGGSAATRSPAAGTERADQQYAVPMFPDLSMYPPEHEDIALAAWDLLAAGPLSLADIAAHCREDGLLDEVVRSQFDTDLDAIGDVTMFLAGIWTTRSGTATRLDLLLQHRVFTHRLTDTERTTAEIVSAPDLSILDADVSEFAIPLTLVGGHELHVNIPAIDEEGETVLAGPHGWLDGFNQGELLAFTKESDGSVDLFPVDTTGDGQAEATAIRDEFDARNRDPEAGYDLWPVLIEAIATGSDLFTTPVPPIDELLASVGLEHRNGYIGPTDTGWLPAGVVFARRLRAELGVTYGFDPCCHVALDTVIDAWDWSLGVVATEPDPAATAKALDHGDVVAAFISWIDSTGGALIDVASFFEGLGERAGRHGAMPLGRAAWIFFTEGDIDDAIEDAEAAIALDPDNLEATVLLGHVAAIRGDHRQALRLLRRSAPDDGWVEILESIFEPFPDAKRNDPCPCGSQKKFKVCCATAPRISGIARMRLLTHKVVAFLYTVESAHLHYLGHIAATADGRNDPHDIDRFVNHPFLVEIAAIEGSLDFFSEVWGPLLPQDERDTIDLWRTSTRALWEVTGEPEGSYVTLRDTRTGDSATVYDETAGPEMHAGMLLMAVVAPAFGEDRFLSDPLIVDIRHRDTTLALFDEVPTDVELAQWFGLFTAPPRLRTTEGQDMVSCRAVCEPTSTWAALEAELDAHCERTDVTEDAWHTSFVNDNGDTIIRGSLTKEGSQLIIETMSEERLDAILATLTQVTVLHETRDPVTVPGILEAPPSGPSVVPEPLDPEAYEMLTEIMRQKEEAWLDENIPALDGLTPRQAAADPTRRHDLIALLDTFSQIDDGTAMGFDADRLRHILGLD